MERMENSEHCCCSFRQRRLSCALRALSCLWLGLWWDLLTQWRLRGLRAQLNLLVGLESCYFPQGWLTVLSWPLRVQLFTNNERGQWKWTSTIPLFTWQEKLICYSNSIGFIRWPVLFGELCNYGIKMSASDPGVKPAFEKYTLKIWNEWECWLDPH